MTEKWTSRGDPIDVFFFKSGKETEARGHPAIKYSPYQESCGGGPDLGPNYWLDGFYSAEGSAEIQPGSVLLTFADGSYAAMKTSLFLSLYKRVKP